MNNISMLNSVWSVIGDLLTGILAIVPQSIYFLFASAASMIDLLLFVIRKLVGLDSYYVNGEKTSGDIVSYLLEGILGINQDYSILNTVFWAMIIFGAILLVFATIIAMLKSHYDYDAKKLTAMQVINKMVKGLLTIAIVPIVTIFGVYLSEIFVRTLDALTTGSSETSINEIYESEAINKFSYAVKEEKDGKKIYSSLDFYGMAEYSSMYSFSGAIFNAAAYNANRVRQGRYTAVSGETNSYWKNMEVFYTTSETDVKEKIAIQIDTAFEYALTLKTGQSLLPLPSGSDTIGLITSYSGISAVFVSGLINVKTFSKFNVGLVFYYYNLWSFDWVVAFAGIITAVTLLFNLVLGLIRRIFLVLILFLIYPPITALHPLDDGNGFKSWRQNFVKNFLSSISMITALNIISLLLPFFRNITFFDIALLDNIMAVLFSLTCLVVVKKLIKILSDVIGADNIEEAGGKIAKEFGQVAAKGIQAALKLMDVGVSAGKGGFSPLVAAGKGIAKASKNKKIRNKLKIEKGKKVTDADRAQYASIMAQEKRDKKIDNKIAKKQDEYGAMADEILDVSDPGIDKSSEEYKAKRESMIREFAQKDVDGELSNSKFVNKNRKAIDKLRQENAQTYDSEAYNELKKKYGEDALSQLKKDDAGKYAELLESEKDNLAAKDLKKERRAKRRQSLKETGGELLDIGGATFKLLGDLSGISGLKETLNKAGTTETFKAQVQKYFKALGFNSIGSSDYLKTEKQKKEEETAKTESSRAELQKTADEFRNKGTEAVIENLIQNFQDYKTSVDKWKECSVLARQLLNITNKGKKAITADEVSKTVRAYGVDPNRLRNEIEKEKREKSNQRSGGKRKTKVELAKELLLAQGFEEKNITDRMLKETANKYTAEQLKSELQKLKPTQTTS